MLANRLSRLSLTMGGVAPKMAPKISTTTRTCTNFFAAIFKPVEAVTASPSVAALAMLMPSIRALVAVAAVTVLTPVAFAMEAGGGDLAPNLFFYLRTKAMPLLRLVLCSCVT